MKTKKGAPVADSTSAEWLEEIKRTLAPLSLLEDVARTLGCSVRTTRRLIISRHLTRVKLGKEIRVTRDSVLRLLEARAS